jgi:hypothetical protein
MVSYLGAEQPAKACRNYESDPENGWRGKSLRPSFLETRPFVFLDQLASEIQERFWQ